MSPDWPVTNATKLRLNGVTFPSRPEPAASASRVPSILAVTAGSPILGTICFAGIGFPASVMTSTMSRYTSGSTSTDSPSRQYGTISGVLPAQPVP